MYWFLLDRFCIYVVYTCISAACGNIVLLLVPVLSWLSCILTDVINLQICVFADMQYQKLVNHERMQGIKNKTVWVNVSIPGQEPDAPDLPAG